ncbi:MAG: hypothetical protein IPG71_05865 [bacterium]|nr:hypothetical protein [bacterium]
MTKSTINLIILICAALLLASCADPRTPPPAAPVESHTETITLWNSARSDGIELTASFNVERDIADYVTPDGFVQPARLSIAAYIRPDSDIAWFEAIVGDTFPIWDDILIRYAIGFEAQKSVLDSVVAVRALCDSLPESCPDDTSGLIPAEHVADSIKAIYQDSIAVAVADTTELGGRRDSLGLVLDDRYTLAIWLDDDSATAYPLATRLQDGRIADQSIYLAETNFDSGLKGRGFDLDLAGFYVADLNKVDRQVFLNWASCFRDGVPCLTQGSHTLRARVTGAETYVTAALILVYAEE